MPIYGVGGGSAGAIADDLRAALDHHFVGNCDHDVVVFDWNKVAEHHSDDVLRWKTRGKEEALRGGGAGAGRQRITILTYGSRSGRESLHSYVSATELERNLGLNVSLTAVRLVEIQEKLTFARAGRQSVTQPVKRFNDTGPTSRFSTSARIR